MQISDHRYLEKSSKFLRQKLTRLEDQCVDLVTVHVDNDESRCASGTTSH